MGYMDPKTVATKLTHLFVTLTLAVLGVRVVFSLLDADLTNSLVRWVYSTSVPLMSPFRGLFNVYVGPEEHVLEMPVIFAMVAYGLVGLVTLRLIDWASSSKSKR